MNISNVSRKSLFFKKWKYRLDGNVRWCFLLGESFHVQVLLDFTDPQDRTSLYSIQSIINEAEPSSYKISTSVGRRLHIYSNDLNLLKRIVKNSIPHPRQSFLWKITAVNNIISSEFLKIKGNKFKFRTYFRARALQIDDAAHLMSFFENNADHIKPSLALIACLSRSVEFGYSRVWFRDYYHVDYNDEMSLSPLLMTCPVVIRKTLPIVDK